jgi:hypothetical protein
MLRIDLPGRPHLYGEYRQRFADNHNDFDIEIVSFGLTDPRNAGIPQPSRLRLSAQERAAAEQLIRVLFCSAEAAAVREGMSAFSLQQSTFLGGIHFLPGWILDDGVKPGQISN